MSERDLNLIASLEKKQKMGIWKYIAIYGGVFMLLMLLFRIGSDYYFNELPEDFLSLNFVLRQLVSTAIGGVIFGSITWYFNKSRYKELKKKQANESNS